MRGFKCFTIESGVEVFCSPGHKNVPEPVPYIQEFPCVNEQDLHLAMKELAVCAR